jgi:hypothetical protein
MYWRAAAFAALGLFAFWRAAMGGPEARLMGISGLVAAVLAVYLLARALRDERP